MAHLHHYTEPDESLPAESIDIAVVFGEEEQELVKEEEEAEELLKHQDDVVDGDNLVVDETQPDTQQESQANGSTTENDVVKQEDEKPQEEKTPKKKKSAIAKEQLVKLHDLLEKAQTYTNFLIEDGLMTEKEAIQKSKNDLQPGVASTSNANGKRPREDDEEEQPLKKVKKAVKHEQPKILDGGQMRHYQLVGMNWLISLYENGVSGILADEMGLGKTIQTIALLAHLYEKNIKGPFLIVAPLSTLSNWKNETARFTPRIPALLYHGSKQDRATLRATELPKLTMRNPQLSILITSYEMSMKDARYLRRVPFKYLIVDEAHRLKNFNCKLTRELKTYSSENRLLLTGTPLQNNLTELWSLLNFLIPELFDDLDNFRKWFDFSDKSEDKTLDEEKPKLINKLHNILRPFILRRMKTDVELDLPTKKEYLLFAPMTEIQAEYYQAVKDKDLAPLIQKHAELADSAGSTRLVNILMQLRKVCNHPYLITEFQSNPDETVDEANDRFVRDCISTCGKFKLLNTMLEKLQTRGHKVLLFSLMTRMLDVLEDFLEVKGIKYCRLDGSVSQSIREERIKNFNEDPEIFIFLLSTRAGGLGINLTAADTVVIYDSDWNPQIDLQAQDRCHRIGQTRPVRVFRLLTTNSVEKKIWQTAQKKLQLEKLIIHKGNFKGAASKGKKITLTATSLMDILAHSDQEELKHANGLSEESLELLLDRTRNDLTTGEGYEVVNYDRENLLEWTQQ